MKRLILLIGITIFIFSCKKEKDGCWHCVGSNGTTKIVCGDTVSNYFNEYYGATVIHYECER